MQSIIQITVCARHLLCQAFSFSLILSVIVSVFGVDSDYYSSYYATAMQLVDFALFPGTGQKFKEKKL